MRRDPAKAHVKDKAKEANPCGWFEARNYFNKVNVSRLSIVELDEGGSWRFRVLGVLRGDATYARSFLQYVAVQAADDKDVFSCRENIAGCTQMLRGRHVQGSMTDLQRERDSLRPCCTLRLLDWPEHPSTRH